MNRWEAVTYKGEHKQRTILVRDPVEIDFAGGRALTGVQVDYEGEEVASAGHDERRVIIGTDLVVRRSPMFMSTKYGRLQRLALTPAQRTTLDLIARADHQEAREYPYGSERTRRYAYFGTDRGADGWTREPIRGDVADTLCDMGFLAYRSRGEGKDYACYVLTASGAAALNLVGAA